MDLIEIRQNEIQKLYIICLEEGNIIETKIEKKTMLIQLDFDGTVVEFDYPKIGLLNEGCIEV